MSSSKSHSKVNNLSSESGAVGGITGRKKAKQPSQVASHFSPNLNMMPCPMLMTNRDGSIEDINSCFVDLAGHDKPFWQGRSMDDLLSVPGRMFLQTHLWPMLYQCGHIEEIKLEIVDKNGARIPVLVNCKSTEHEGVESYCWVLFISRERSRFEAELIEARKRSEDRMTLIAEREQALIAASKELLTAQDAARDVTESKRMEQVLQLRNIDLEKATAIAEEASLAKSNFLSSMSHELRTPLNAILGFAQLIDSSTSPPTPQQKRSIDQILSAGWYLLELVNEILDLAQIESGKVVLSREAVPLEHLLSQCLAMIEPLAHKRGIEMSFPRLDRLHYVDADSTRTKQVLTNLLHNAIKYNKPEGMVFIGCTPVPPNSIRISVRDTGLGLTPEQLGQLFQPFNRLGRESTGEQGTGIGLVVVKQLVELMGGIVGVESQVGVGSTFWIELNLTTEPEVATGKAEQEEPVTSNSPESSVARRTVLYVEDNPANLALVEELVIRRPNLRLISAADGNLGIEFARTYLPDVILMDLHLPGIGGVEAMKILRADPSTTHIPIIAISANAMPADIELAMKAGFFHYLTKPIRLNEFMTVLDAALEH